MRLIDFDALKKLVEQRLDMQDLYLPVHFLDIAEELADKGPWKPFLTRQLTDEEKIDHPGWCYILDCELPDDDEEVLVSNGKYVWVDTYINNGDECYLDSGHELDGAAWMPMPDAYMGGGDDV